MKPIGGVKWWPWKYFTILLALGFLVGCAGVETTQDREDAIAKGAGHTLALTMLWLKPELATAAKYYCIIFESREIQDTIEAQDLLGEFLTYLSDKYVGNPQLAIATMNALEIIGLSRDRVESIIVQEIDKAVEIEGITEDMLHKGLLVVQGFCEMI
jgi:hypothetical protein